MNSIIIRKKVFQKILFTFILILVSATQNSILFAQEDGDDIIIGKYKKIHSEVLNEDRLLLVHLPNGYNENTSKKYPVVYHLYGDYLGTYFYESSAILDQLGESAVTPEFILIGIANTNRYRDLLPINRQGNSDDIDKFQSFINTEVFTYVEKNYRTEDYKVLVAPQAGSAFSMYNLCENPDMFNAHIIDFSFQLRENVCNLLETKMVNFLSDKKNSLINNSLFITLKEDAFPFNRKVIDSINKITENNKKYLNNFNYNLNLIKNNTDLIQPLDLKKGLKTIFSEYKFNSNPNKVTNLDEIKNHYKKLSKKYNYSIQIPNRILVLEGDKLRQQRKPNLAKEIFEFAIEQNPSELNCLMRLAQIYESEARYKEALDFYGKALKIRTEPYFQSKIKSLNRIVNSSASYLLENNLKKFNEKSTEKLFQKISLDSSYYFDETELNNAGYRLLQLGKLKEAIFLFKINTIKFPTSGNAFDSYAESLLKNGLKKEAIKNYERSIELNPKNENAIDILNKLQKKESNKIPLLTGLYLGQKKPGNSPVIFAPEIISTKAKEFSLTISPAGDEIFFTRKDPIFNRNTIMVTRIDKNGYWTNPIKAKGAGDIEGFEATFSFDGKTIFFKQWRKRDGIIGVKPDIWFMNKNDTGWSKPEHLKAPFNPDNSMFITTSKSGNFYTTDTSRGFNTGRIVKTSMNEDGSFKPFEVLKQPININQNEMYPFISPDEDYIIFSSRRESSNGKESDLFISYHNKHKDIWSNPVKIETRLINCTMPWVSNDNKFLFFSSTNGENQGDIYWMRTDFF